MDVREILEQKNIDYTPKGRDYIVRCLSPEHDDNNPSLRIDKITGKFGCFSCGFSGDIFQYFGENNNRYIDTKVEGLLEEINKLMWSKPKEIPLDAVFMDRDFRYIKGSTYSEFNAFTTESMHDMEGRIVFPLYDINGDITCFQGRYMYSDLEPRYSFYPSDATVPLYPPVPKAINNSIILVEGFFDFLNLYDKGLTNAVCTFGTSFGLVKKRVKQNANIERLLQYKYQGIDTIYILYDGDEPGRHAASNLEDYLGSKFRVKVIEMEEGTDPGGLDITDVKRLKEHIYG